MVSLIFKKFMYGFSILFGVLTIVFFLFKILPADPARMMLDKREDAEQLELINQNMALINLFLYSILAMSMIFHLFLFTRSTRILFFNT